MLLKSRDQHHTLEIIQYFVAIARCSIVAIVAGSQEISVTEKSKITYYTFNHK